MDISLGELWQSASVVLALQATSIGWRINRESQLAEDGKPTWMPVADILNLIALAVSVLGVFVSPVLGVSTVQTAATVFGLVLILMLGHVVALAGHYELFKWGPRSHTYLPDQEWYAVVATMLVAGLYSSMALLGR